MFHVLLKHMGPGNPISCSFAETCLALGTTTEVASNYARLTAKAEQWLIYHIVHASDALVILGHMSWFMHGGEGYRRTL